jgi:hypothetical protein
MRRLLIAAPWIPAIGAAVYTAVNFDRLPNTLAVTFFGGAPSGWGPKERLFLFLALMFGMLTVYSALLLYPRWIRTRSPRTATLMGTANTALADASSDRRTTMRIVTVAHFAFSILMPLSIAHIVHWNLPAR